MKKYLPPIFFLLIFLEGIIALYFLFQIPSEDKNNIIFGFSILRMGLGLFVLSLLVLVVFLLVGSVKKFKTWKAIVDKFEVYSIQEILFFRGIASVGFSILFLAFIIIVFTFGSPQVLGTPYVIYQRAGPIIYWFLAISIQLFILALLSRENSIERIRKSPDQIWKTILVWMLFAVSICHWVILVFRLPIFTDLPGWFWYFRIKEYTINDFLFVLFFLVSFMIAWFVLNNPSKKVLNILLLIALGYILQIGFGFIDGGGFTTIRDKDAGGGHRRYAEYASTNLELFDTLVNYEEYFIDDTYLSTKPPGVMLFYIVTQRVSTLVNPVQTYQERVLRLIDFAARTFPLLSFAVLYIIFLISKKIFDNNDYSRYFPVLLFLFLPNIILMPLTLYQVLYPLLFSLGILFTMSAIKSRSFIQSFLTGIFIYISFYFSFSLLPILPFAVLIIVINYFFQKETSSLREAIFVLAGMGGGVILAFLLFKIILNYDFFLRYQTAMDYHRYYDFVIRLEQTTTPVDKSFYPDFLQILRAIRLNNLEYFSWMGFPVAVLFISRVYQALIAVTKGKVNLLDQFTIAFFITFCALNIFGETKSEVGRIWLGLTPAFALCAGYELLNLFDRKKSGMYYFIGLQIVTMMALFKYQDFYL